MIFPNSRPDSDDAPAHEHDHEQHDQREEQGSNYPPPPPMVPDPTAPDAHPIDPRVFVT